MTEFNAKANAAAIVNAFLADGSQPEFFGTVLNQDTEERERFYFCDANPDCWGTTLSYKEIVRDAFLYYYCAEGKNGEVTYLPVLQAVAAERGVTVCTYGQQDHGRVFYLRRLCSEAEAQRRLAAWRAYEAKMAA